MGSKPKAQDYKPSEADKASASVAMAEYKYFKEKYDPLLQEMRDKSLTDDYKSTLRGRASADTMQALTSKPSYQQTQNLSAAGDMAQAVQGQLGEATTAAKTIENRMQSNVLGTARGQAADAQSGMAQAARLGTSTALARAQANQQVAQSKLSAATQIGSALAFQGIDNMQTRGPSDQGPPTAGSFFTPVDPNTGQKVSGLGNRFNYSTGG